MPLILVEQLGTLDDDRDGVLSPMIDGADTISILVSGHALEDVDPPAHVDGHMERFNEYRRQFEQIASDKYDKRAHRAGWNCMHQRQRPAWQRARALGKDLLAGP